MKTVLILIIFLTVSCSSNIVDTSDFQAKIGDEVIFEKSDILFVCTTSDCSGIDINRDCVTSNNVYTCQYSFIIKLNQEAAEKMARTTSELDIDSKNFNHLNKNLDFYYNGEIIESVNIGIHIKNNTITSVPISVDGQGDNRSLAIKDATNKAKNLRGILLS